LTETVVQHGPEAINRFKMHRLRRPNFPRRGVLLLLPSLGNSFDMYLVNEDGHVQNSFAAVYARAGIEVWGFSPRTTFLNAGDCAGPMNCSPVLNWNLQTIVDDVTYIRSRIATAAPGHKPAIGGLSMGAAAGIAVVNAHPNDYAALLAWEGSLVTENAAYQAHALNFCNQFSGMVGAGLAVDDQSLPLVKQVAQLAEAAPNAPFAIPIPGFPPGLTNYQALVLILSTPNPIAPSPRPGFISAAGDVMNGTFTYAAPDRVFASVAAFDEVTSNAATRDLYCSLAGVDTAHTSNLQNFTKPVMIIKGGQGFGPIMDELPGKLGSTSVTTIGLDGYGHVDHSLSPNHWFVLELPVGLWLEQVFP
jgi:pimeloyl-ACP methyl ester carboxylesterase